MQDLLMEARDLRDRLGELSDRLSPQSQGEIRERLSELEALAAGRAANVASELVRYRARYLLDRGWSLLQSSAERRAMDAPWFPSGPGLKDVFLRFAVSLFRGLRGAGTSDRLGHQPMGLEQMLVRGALDRYLRANRRLATWGLRLPKRRDLPRVLRLLTHPRRTTVTILERRRCARSAGQRSAR
jgi:hypothetical protein